MTKITVNEFRSDPDRTLAMLEAGTEVEVIRDGEVVARMLPASPRRLQGAELETARERMRRLLARGVPLGGGPYIYEDKYGDAEL